MARISLSCTMRIKDQVSGQSYDQKLMTRDVYEKNSPQILLQRPTSSGVQRSTIKLFQ